MQVNAPFMVEHPTGGNIDSVFECHQHHGIVPAMSALRLPVSITLHYILELHVTCLSELLRNSGMCDLVANSY